MALKRAVVGGVNSKLTAKTDCSSSPSPSSPPPPAGEKRGSVGSDVAVAPSFQRAEPKPSSSSSFSDSGARVGGRRKNGGG